MDDSLVAQHYNAYTPFAVIVKGLEDGWYGTIEITLHNLKSSLFSGKIQLNLNNKEILSLPVQSKEEYIHVTAKVKCMDVLEWSIETPILYSLETVLQDNQSNSLDDLIERVGFRTITIQGKDILLNGRKVRIKGFCRHEDHPQFGCAIPFAAMQQDIMIMKDMRANSVRTSHYPNDELFLDLCDENGILVWKKTMQEDYRKLR